MRKFQLGEIVLREIVAKFKVTSWEKLYIGQTMYYLVPNHYRQVHGPFVVVDPAQGRLKNMNGVQMNLPNVLPVLLYE